jgi:hypothetical protein
VTHLWSELRYLFSRSKDALLIRNLLRSDPRWIRGHRLLAKFEIDRQLKATEKREMRSLGTIESSARALRALGEDSGRISYIQAMYDFFSSNYGEALDCFQYALNSKSLSRTSIPLACEYGAASAMMVGDRELAKRLFESIPPRDRNGDVLAALSLLEEEGIEPL